MYVLKLKPVYIYIYINSGWVFIKVSGHTVYINPTISMDLML